MKACGLSATSRFTVRDSASATGTAIAGPTEFSPTPFSRKRPANLLSFSFRIITSACFRACTEKTEAVVDMGGGVKTFEVANKGDVPCNGRRPCSPDGKWKAALVSASLDAGPENEFRDGRVSCIAGPCPFTRISRDHFSRGGRVIDVTVLNWSDTTTFPLQAEAVRHMRTDATRKSYPVVFDRTMNFSLSASAEGTCIEAEVDGTQIVFPIVPNLSLSWADCDTQSEPENNKTLSL
jgi:hypothetical protein